MPKSTVKPKKSQKKSQKKIAKWLGLVRWGRIKKTGRETKRKITWKRAVWEADQVRARRMRGWIDDNPPPRMGHQAGRRRHSG